MSLSSLLSFPSFPKPLTPKQPNPSICCASNLDKTPITTTVAFLSNAVVTLAIAVTLNLNFPLSSLAIPSLSSRAPPPPSPTTPFSQSKKLQIGLENGKIRPCPAINPGCITTNPKSSSFTFPLTIPDIDSKNAVQKLQDAIIKTQKNANIQVNENTPDGQYLQAEVDGGYGRDVLEFLVKKDVVVYRTMATKVIYVYPFTTALGDSKGQEERLKKIVDELGWYAPSFENSMEMEDES